jgi:hypothetical protein
MATNLTALKPLQLFSVGLFEGYGVPEKLTHDSRTKTAIQSEAEAISTETLTKILINFVLHLNNVCDPRGHHTKNVLV